LAHQNPVWPCGKINLLSGRSNWCNFLIEKIAAKTLYCTIFAGSDLRSLINLSLSPHRHPVNTMVDHPQELIFDNRVEHSIAGFPGRELTKGKEEKDVEAVCI
jgi:hypothetical protein